MLLWTVVLVAPGGFLLVPVLAAASLSGGGARDGVAGSAAPTLRERLALLVADARQAMAALHRRWTKR